MLTDRFACPQRKTISSANQLADLMARTKADQRGVVEDRHELDVFSGECGEHRLNRVARLNCSSMPDQFPQIDIVSTQRVADLNVQRCVYLLLRRVALVTHHRFSPVSCTRDRKKVIVTFS